MPLETPKDKGKKRTRPKNSDTMSKTVEKQVDIFCFIRFEAGGRIFLCGLGLDTSILDTAKMALVHRLPQVRSTEEHSFYTLEIA